MARRSNPIQPSLFPEITAPPASEKRVVQAPATGRVIAFPTRKPPARKRGITLCDSRFRKLTSELRLIMEDDRWAEASPPHYVAFYALMHERVYGVAAAELDSVSRQLAVFAVKRLLNHQFDGDKVELAKFLWWTWDRELKDERFRRENARQTKRITWRQQFVTGWLLTNYRQALLLGRSPFASAM